MLINFTNHSSSNWSAEQRSVATDAFGSIVDIPFPEVDPAVGSNQIIDIAETQVAKISALSPDAVLCQGEFSLAFAVAALLIKKGIKVVCACSERNVMETIDNDGNAVKKAVFKFVRFREYKLPNRA